MTLITAYKEHNVPILLGDVLITGGNDELHCKKVNKISDNFVIGWTGRKLNAMQVLKKLFEKFGGQDVRMEEVQKFLLGFDASQFVGEETENKLIMIGWVIDQQEHCFLWNSDYDAEVFFNDEKGFFAGSGSEFFEGLLNDLATFKAQSPGLTSHAKAVSRVLNEMCSLTNAEYLAVDKSWRTGFGFAYEALLYDGRKFSYVNNVMYFTVNIFTSDKWEILRYEVLPNIYRYKSFGHLSLFQILTNGNTDTETHQYYVGRGYNNDAQKQLDYMTGIMGRPPLLSPNSDYYCMTQRVINRTKSFGGAITIMGNNNNLFKIRYKESQAIFSFSPAFHRLVLESIELNKRAIV